MNEHTTNKSYCRINSVKIIKFYRTSVWTGKRNRKEETKKTIHAYKLSITKFDATFSSFEHRMER